MIMELFTKVRLLYASSRGFVRTASAVVEEHKSLLWVLGTGSSALAGWAVYTMRKLHYARIEEAMSQITGKITELEKSEKESQEVGQHVGNSTLHLALVTTPAVTSALLLGYMIGRVQGSYLCHRQVQ